MNHGAANRTAGTAKGARAGEGIAVHRGPPGGWKPRRGKGADALARIIANHARKAPEKALLIAAPGLDIRPESLHMLEALAGQANGGDAFTVLSNADPALNPFAGSSLPADTRLDLAALVALLGPGEMHPVHRTPEHLILFPAATAALLAQAPAGGAGFPGSPWDRGGRLLLHDRIFVPDPTRPLTAEAGLEPHESRRPAPWGRLNARIEDWLQEPERLESRAAAIGEFSDRSLAGEGADLHITHSWGGGVARWVESFIEADAEHLHLQLRSEGAQSGQGAGQRLALYAGNWTENPLAAWWLEPVIAGSAARHEQYREILEYIAARFGVKRVLVSSLVGHSLDALRQDQPTVQVLHDFYPAWPLLGIHPQAYLRESGGADLAAGMAEHRMLPDLGDRDAESWRGLGDAWLQAVRDRGVRMVAPSRSVADMMPRLDEGWGGAGIQVVPHGLPDMPVPAPAATRARPDGRLRLLIPGRIQEGKGKALLLAALPELRKLARVCLLGSGKDGEDFFGLAGVDVIINYERKALPDTVRRLAPDAAALLSTVPETFSYTLSEMRLLGIPVIATSVGSLVERIEDGVDGWLIEPTAEALVARVRELAEDRERLVSMRRRLETTAHRSARDMVADYARLCPALERLTPALVVRSPERSQAGALASLLVEEQRLSRRLDRQLRESRRELEARTQWARERDRALAREQQEKIRWVNRLEEHIEDLTGALDHERSEHRHTLEQYQMVLASTSWRITRPLRAARRLAANFMRARAWNPLRWPLLLGQFVRTVRTLGWHDALTRMQTAQVVHEPRGLETGGVEGIGDPEPPPGMPRSDHPLVSIVIPVHNQWLYTAACLRSVAEAECKAAFEVIVIDDESDDETPVQLARVKGLDVARNENNLGFVGSCNRGAARADGKFIVLLNNDTQVMDGWLDHLLHTFQQFPDTGLAGARLVYPDGRLQECGGIVFSDGSGWNYGRGDEPDRPEYQYVREADYCSGACIMLPRKLFSDLGGFDKEFAPAYYEDTDLAFRVCEQGLKVRVQPAATVIHHEGVSSGTDINSGAKRFQAVNRRKFLERWQRRLARHPAPIAKPDDRAEVRAARDHRLKGRVLIIDAYTPEPDQDSGSLRLRYLMDCFFELGYGVTFFPDNRSHARRYTAELQQAGVEAWYHPWLDSLQGFFSRHGGEFDFVIVCRHYVAANYIGLIRRYCPRAKFLFDTIDLHYLREQRLAELEDSPPLRRAAAQTRRSELGVINQADATLVVSPAEVEVLREDAPGAAVHLLSNIHRVVGSQKPFGARKDIFFVGGFQHPPNIDAAQWFCNAVWPLIRKELPDVEFHLIGSKAPDQVKALHGNGVVFHGFVPRLEPFLDGCRLAVAPLRYGAGVKGKVNLSMSRGQPVVATPAAVEGLLARDGEDVLVASEPAEFAAAVVRLYTDAALWNRISRNAVDNVNRFFSLDTARRNLKALLESFQRTPSQPTTG